jgi:hypothetical protein
MTQHTPGPWHATKRGPDCNFLFNITPTLGHSHSIAQVIDAGCIEQVNQYQTPNTEQAANARLIAAAPDLLNLATSMAAMLNSLGYSAYRAALVGLDIGVTQEVQS